MTRDFIGPQDWDSIELVAFDVDGTLYPGPISPAHGARDLLHALSNWSFETIAVLRTYRRIRERLGDRKSPDFEHALIPETAAATDHSPDTVRAMVTKWIEQRPLRHLADYRYPLLPELFAGLRRKGKVIGILWTTRRLRSLRRLDCRGPRRLGRRQRHRAAQASSPRSRGLDCGGGGKRAGNTADRRPRGA